MTDSRPQPKYGEYAPTPPAVVEPPRVVDEAAAESIRDAAARPRRSWDVILTTALLLVGVFDVVTGFEQFANLAATLRTFYEQQGYGAFTSVELAAAMGLVANITRIVLLVAAIVVSLLRIARNLLAFWAPLGAGVIAALVVVVCILVTVLGDPALAEFVQNQQQ